MTSVLILRAPGTNCDQETAYAFRRAGAEKVDIVHINNVLESPKTLGAARILCFPGGFSFGDDIAAGRIFASKIDNHLRDELLRFREADKLILGICNGFQVLLKLGLIFDNTSGATPATLTWNQNPLYTDRWVHLVTEKSDCVFLRNVTSLYLPIAHAQGRFVIRSQADREAMQKSGQLALRYREGDNPNGSDVAVSGACDRTGRVFGLMPHPERFIDAVQHPHWTRKFTPDDFKEEFPGGDGLAIFKNAVSYFQS